MGNNNTSFFLKYPIKIQGSFYISDGLSSTRVKSHETINIEQYNIDSIEEVYLNVKIFNSKLNLYFDFNKTKTELRIYTGKNCQIKPINGVVSLITTKIHHSLAIYIMI